MPNARIRNDVVNVKSRNKFPNVFARNFQTTRSGEGVIPAGTPIGLLLALTYAADMSKAIFGDFRPNVRIRND